MNPYRGETLSWELRDDIIELSLHRAPCNEIGSQTLRELESFVAALSLALHEARALILYSAMPAGFCAGADLRELYQRAFVSPVPEGGKLANVRIFLERIHSAFNTLDDAPLPTIAAVHGVTFGGGLELALTADILVADRMARFCFPELRLGLIPGFGGIPRLKRDLGNGIVRDLLLTGRSINATRAQAAGLVSQLAGDGEALSVARATAHQLAKFDPYTARAAKKFTKPIPRGELQEEIDIFCDLFGRPAVADGLRKFVEGGGPLPYLP